MIVLFCGIIAFLFFTNNKSDEKQTEPVVGKYLYIDTNETLHVRRYCPAIGKQVGELGGVNRAVSRIPVNSITNSMLDYSCSRCVNDDIYEELRTKALANDETLIPPSRR